MGRRRLWMWVVLGLLVASVPAVGDEIRLLPMISVREEYNDNIFFSSKDELRDFVTILSPGLKLDRNTERLKAALSARIDQRLYADNTELNATDQFYAGTVSYAFTPMLRIGAKAGYSQDASPDRDIETTGLVQRAVQRDRQSYGLFGDYVFTEKTQASLSADYFQDRYAEFGNSDLQNLDATSANLMVIHDIGTLLPETKARAGLGYARYQYTDATTENYSGTVGLSRQFNEVWNAVVDVGCRYTPSQFEITQLQFIPPFSFGLVTETVETSGWGAVGNAVVSYTGEKTRLDFSLKHDIAPASGRATAAERTSLGFSMRRKFTQELSGVFSSGYFLNNYTPGDEISRNVDEQTLYVNPGIRYDITRDMAVDATYTYTRTEYQRETDSAADRSLVMVRFYLQYPILE